MLLADISACSDVYAILLYSIKPCAYLVHPILHVAKQLCLRSTFNPKRPPLVTMYKFFWAIAAFTLALSTASAQEAKTQPSPTQTEVAPAPPAQKPTPEERATRNADRMTKGLSLTSAEREQVYAVFLKQFTKVEELRKERKLKGQVDAIRTETDAQLKTILGPEKFAKYTGNRQNRAQKVKAKRAGQPAGADGMDIE